MDELWSFRDEVSGILAVGCLKTGGREARIITNMMQDHESIASYTSGDHLQERQMGSPEHNQVRTQRRPSGDKNTRDLQKSQDRSSFRAPP
jgi:hypothetical protein